ncbi:MAG: response regulator [Oryzihumus sp.]
MDRVFTRVLVVDDHSTFAELLCGALDREPDFASVGHAATAAEAVRMFQELRPDLVIMDIELADSDGFAATDAIVRLCPDARVVMLTAHASGDFLSRAVEAGACGFLPKDGQLSEMLQLLRSAGPGEIAVPAFLAQRLVSRIPRDEPEQPAPRLTTREQEVLALIGKGKNARAVSRELNISTHTCRGYIRSVLAKLGAHSQLEAVVIASRLGLLQIDRV